MRGPLAADDETFLKRAIELGRQGWGRVHPNPMVGCVLVREGGVVGEGAHLEFGGRHAEVRALEEAGERARGATAYVSLEPCRHTGKTPPCVNALVGAGIERVVFWASDPGPESGGGGAWLAERGIAVEGPVGVRSEWAEENPFFFHERGGLPYVALKLAVSIDGGLAPASGVQRWLTGPAALEQVHRIRAGFGAILVGSGTWRADDPRLTVRGSIVPREPPVRVLLDRKGGLTPSARVFHEGEAPVWVATRPGNAPALEARLEGRGSVLAVPEAGRGLDVIALLGLLAERGIDRVLCEGGAALAASLIESDAVDRMYLFRAPVFLGEGRIQALAADPAGSPEPRRWKPVGEVQRFGEDVLTILDRRSD